MRKVELLPTRDCEAGYGPVCSFPLASLADGIVALSGTTVTAIFVSYQAISFEILTSPAGTCIMIM